MVSDHSYISIISWEDMSDRKPHLLERRKEGPSKSDENESEGERKNKRYKLTLYR